MAYNTPSTIPYLKSLPAWQLFSELIVILMIALAASHQYLDLDPDTRLGGVEAEYLTRTGFSLSTLLPEMGYIPKWQPYLEYGDPLLENPVSTYFNPFVTLTTLLFGPPGIKITIVVTAVVAGLGGWALARTLNLGVAGRLLLAALCIGKGNMHAYAFAGHYALIITQAYFPYILAALVGMSKGFRRWPLILFGLFFSMLFHSGLPWFPPAMVLASGIILLGTILRRKAESTRATAWFQRYQIRWGLIASFVLAGALALGLSAVSFLPVWENRDRIGGQTVEVDSQVPLPVLIEQFISGTKDSDDPRLQPPGSGYSFYSYVAPAWYLLLLAGITVIIMSHASYRQHLKFDLQMLLVFGAIFLFFMLWGGGQNPFLEWAYQNIPYADQFRHVSRAMGIASLGLAAVVALLLDGLLKSIQDVPSASGTVLRMVASIILIVSSVLAAWDVVRQWDTPWGEHTVQPSDPWETQCIQWLRAQYPDKQLNVWTLEYQTIYVYLENRVRHGWVASDYYHALPIPHTIFDRDLIPRGTPLPHLLPEFAIGGYHYDEAWMLEHGYVPLPESENREAPGTPCIYQREGALPYAFWIDKAILDTQKDLVDTSLANEVTAFVREYDHIALMTNGRSDLDVVVTAQEVAYPGWSVQVDGQPARIESVGGLIGVVLPREDRPFQIYFQYIPVFLYRGSAITLTTIAFSLLWLLRADQWAVRFWKSRQSQEIAG